MIPSVTIDRGELRRLVEVDLTAEWEDQAIEQFFEDPDDVMLIRERMEDGSIWSWAVVKVRVELRGMSAESCVGGCSYASEDDFKENGGFDEMIDECVEELAQDIERIINTHGVIAHDPIPCLWCAARLWRS